jgi:hypothetical protein
MRFSSIFQRPPSQPLAAKTEAPVRMEPEPARAQLQLPAAANLPEDLDQRVRLIGEWQLGEG